MYARARGRGLGAHSKKGDILRARAAAIAAVAATGLATAALAPGSVPADAGAPRAKAEVLGARITRPAPPRDDRVILTAALTRPQVDVPGDLYEHILDGGRVTWRELGQPGGRVRLVATPRAARAIEADAITMPAARIPAYVARAPDTLAAITADRADARTRAVLRDGVNPLADGAASFVAVGDISFSRSINTRIRAVGDWLYPLRPTAERLASYDLTFGNLETSVSPRFTPPPTGTSFVSDPRALRGLARAGFDAVSLGNNHATNFGLTAFRDSLRHLPRYGIEPFGGGRTLARAHAAARFRIAGERIALLGYNTIVGSSPAARDEPGVAYIRARPFFPFSATDLAAAVADVRREAAAGRFVIVMPHWGVEYTHTPIRDQVRIARALIDAGAGAIVGAHAHWVQGMEFHRARLIAYGLGNFVFDQGFDRETTQGVALEGLVRDGRLVWFDLIPYTIHRLVQPRFVGPRSRVAREVLGDVYGASRSPEFG